MVDGGREPSTSPEGYKSNASLLENLFLRALARQHEPCLLSSLPCPALPAGSFTSPNGSSPLVTEKKSASLCADALQAPLKLPAPCALPEHGSEIVTEPRACQNSPSRIRPYSPKPLPGWRKKLGSQGGTLSRCQERPAPRRAGFLFCSPLLGKHRNRGDFQHASGECAFRERSLKWFIFCWPRFRQTHKQTYFFV